MDPYSRINTTREQKAAEVCLIVVILKINVKF